LQHNANINFGGEKIVGTKDINIIVLR